MTDYYCRMSWQGTACSNGCPYGTAKTICLKACTEYYIYNQASIPPSGLQVVNECDIPNY